MGLRSTLLLTCSLAQHEDLLRNLRVVPYEGLNGGDREGVVGVSWGCTAVQSHKLE